MTIEELEQKGQLFEGWKVIRLIGEGSFGKVYEIERKDEFGVRDVSALKLISIPKNPNDVKELMSEGMDAESASTYFRGFVDEFVRECAIMTKLKGNSNIVSFEDYKVVRHEDGIGYDILIRMELLTAFSDHIKDHPLGREEILDLGIAICKALTTCKKQNVIHRDIKPANIFVSPNGDFKLGDFGISRIAEKSGGASTKVGTNDYMAPEVFKGEIYDASVDIYSLGLVLYRLFNHNRLPFLPPAPAPITYTQREEATARRMNGTDLPMPAEADEAVFEVIRKACAYEASGRYGDPEDMRADLERIRYGTGTTSKTGETPLEPIKEEAVQPKGFVTDFEDEKTSPAANLKREAPIPEERTIQEVKPKAEAQPVSRTSEPVPKQEPGRSDHKGLVIALSCATPILAWITCFYFIRLRMGWPTGYGFITAVLVNIPALIFCVIACVMAKKPNGKPWILYFVGMGITGFLSLIFLLGNAQMSVGCLVMAAGIFTIFGIVINDLLAGRKDSL